MPNLAYIWKALCWVVLLFWVLGTAKPAASQHSSALIMCLEKLLYDILSVISEQLDSFHVFRQVFTMQDSL